MLQSVLVLLIPMYQSELDTRTGTKMRDTRCTVIAVYLDGNLSQICKKVQCFVMFKNKTGAISVHSVQGLKHISPSLIAEKCFMLQVGEAEVVEAVTILEKYRITKEELSVCIITESFHKAKKKKLCLR